MNVESSFYLTESFNEQWDDKLISDDESDIDLEFDEPDVEEPEFVYETSTETESDDEDIP